MHDDSPDAFEKKRQHATQRLVDAAYRRLADGRSVVQATEDLVHMGVDRETAVYVTNHVYRRKRWQIAWQRAGGGARLLLAGLANLLVGAILIAIGLYAARTLGQLYTDLSSWLARGLLFVGSIAVVSGLFTSLWGGFRLTTAGSDEGKGCLPAILIALILLLLAALAYLLQQLLP